MKLQINRLTLASGEVKYKGRYGVWYLCNCGQLTFKVSTRGYSKTCVDCAREDHPNYQHMRASGDNNESITRRGSPVDYLKRRVI